MKKTFFSALEKSLTFFRKLGISRKTPGVSSVYDFLFKIFWPYDQVLEIQGSKMYLNVDKSSPGMKRTIEAYASQKIHEKATTDLFKKVLKEGNVFVDLGANIGYFSLLAAKLVGPSGKVFSFEPEPKNYSYLKKNIDLNGYKQISAFQKAVSDKNGKTVLYVCDYDSGHHTINKYDGVKNYSSGRSTNERPIEIETMTLDGFFEGREDSINVIKMDVEGAEYLALTGMDNILKKNRHLKMFVEFFPLLIKGMGSSPEEFLRKLFKDYGFSVFLIPDDYDSSVHQLKKMESVQEILDLCKGKDDHVNLFLDHK